MKKKMQYESWVETRLWNAKVNNVKISTEKLLEELKYNFNFNRNHPAKKNLRKKILRIRNRVNRKYARHREKAEKLSRQIGVPAELVNRWADGKLINLSNKYECSRISQMIIERDYFMLVKPEKVPQDTSQNLWDF